MASSIKPDIPNEPNAPAPNSLTASDITDILRERNWLGPPAEMSENAELAAWLDRAAQLLGPHAPDRDALVRLLALVFAYEAPALLREQSSQAALARSGAREVIRALANQVLEGGEVNSEGFKQIIGALKDGLPYRGPSLFSPIRLALAGQVGNGALDRVILLLDSAAKLPFATPVKGTRQRILEFCAALD